MTPIRASEVRKGDTLIFTASNGRTLARVIAIEPGKYGSIEIAVRLKRALHVPMVPRALTHFWKLEHFPDDELELHERAIDTPEEPAQESEPEGVDAP